MTAVIQRSRPVTGFDSRVEYLDLVQIALFILKQKSGAKVLENEKIRQILLLNDG